jgi:hypothetical protein
MKTVVEVFLVARTSVRIEVEHEPEESCTDLTDDEADRARSIADQHSVDWDIERVSKVKP